MDKHKGVIAAVAMIFLDDQFMGATSGDWDDVQQWIAGHFTDGSHSIGTWRVELRSGVVREYRKEYM